MNFDPPRAASFGGAAEDEERERKEIEEAEKQPGRAAQGGRAALRWSPATRRASWPASARRSSRGCRREAALRAVTLGAAEALGVADRTGSLEKGKIANVVAWSGEPLAKEAKVKMVFVDGHLYEPDDRPQPAAAPASAEEGR